MAKQEHRGRLQAQGDCLEASESWAQDEPLTARDGLRLLNKLKKKIPEKEVEKRSREFAKAEDLIKRVEQTGGIDAHFSRSFRKKETDDVRVDVEVLGGKAFVCLALFVVLVLILLLKGEAGG